MRAPVPILFIFSLSVAREVVLSHTCFFSAEKFVEMYYLQF